MRTKRSGQLSTVQFNGSALDRPGRIPLTLSMGLRRWLAHQHSSERCSHFQCAPQAFNSVHCDPHRHRPFQLPTNNSAHLGKQHAAHGRYHKSIMECISDVHPNDLPTERSDLRHGTQQRAPQLRMDNPAHSNHIHSDPADTNCTSTVTISPLGCDGQMYYYSIALKVTPPDFQRLRKCAFTRTARTCLRP